MYNTDWICDHDGVPRLIDINGRLSGVVAVPYLGGMGLPWLWYQVTCGKDDFNLTSSSDRTKGTLAGR